jgi:hypothetical protein
MKRCHAVNLRRVDVNPLFEQRANGRAIRLFGGIGQSRPGAGCGAGCCQQHRQSHCARVFRFHDFLNRAWTPMDANNGQRRFSILNSRSLALIHNRQS